MGNRDAPLDAVPSGIMGADCMCRDAGETPSSGGSMRVIGWALSSSNEAWQDAASFSIPTTQNYVAPLEMAAQKRSSTGLQIVGRVGQQLNGRTLAFTRRQHVARAEGDLLDDEDGEGEEDAQPPRKTVGGVRSCIRWHRTLQQKHYLLLAVLSRSHGRPTGKETLPALSRALAGCWFVRSPPA
ncbi:hypothetical protein MKZ38_009733 [Zalerion maritima]|uniref:Uncharacterized protein n=1 Tax=Zalerion maritima TaxID=339359 RepID=A0AAD5RTX0_9PEZI|nr:hypothetical protein MKZ38_009733 [Zalerion maritima]